MKESGSDSGPVDQVRSDSGELMRWDETNFRKDWVEWQRAGAQQKNDGFTTVG